MATTVLTLTKQRTDQAVEQYTYDPKVIDQAIMLGDMRPMKPEMRLAFYRAVCLSVGLSPLSQPFTPMERQDKTIWLYANATCAQQLAALHEVSFTNWRRRTYDLGGEPIHEVLVTATLPSGRSTEALAVVSLTKKKREVSGSWPSGDPKFRDVLDADAEPVLIPLRGEALCNAIMRCETKAFRRGTLQIIGLGWMASELEGSKIVMNMTTGALEGDPREEPRVPRLAAPAEQAKSTADHIADLVGDQPSTGDADIAGLIAQIEAAITHNGGNLAQWYTWGVRTFHREMASWGLPEYERLLAAIRATAARYGQRAQVVPASQSPHDAPEQAISPQVVDVPLAQEEALQTPESPENAQGSETPLDEGQGIS
jgi:hypothetical protein